MRPLSLFVGGLTVAFLLGCGGVWAEASIETMLEELDEIEGMAEDAESEPLLGLVDKVRGGVHDGRVGFFEMIEFRLVVEEQLGDHLIDHDELIEIAQKVDEILAE